MGVLGCESWSSSLVWESPAGTPRAAQREAILWYKEDARRLQAEIQLLVLSHLTSPELYRVELTALLPRRARC